MKSSARAAKSVQRAERNGTGGGPQTAPPLTDIEEIIISFIAESTYKGIKGGRDINAGILTITYVPTNQFTRNSLH